MNLYIKTDSGDVSIGLISGEGVIADKSWQSGRELSDTLLENIEDLLAQQNLTWKDLAGVAVYQGPGSFTGLRIGITIANTLSYSLSIPIVSATGENWLEQVKAKLANGENQDMVMPEYGHEANITKPRK